MGSYNCWLWILIFAAAREMFNVKDLCCALMFDGYNLIYQEITRKFGCRNSIGCRYQVDTISLRNA